MNLCKINNNLIFQEEPGILASITDVIRLNLKHYQLFQVKEGTVFQNSLIVNEILITKGTEEIIYPVPEVPMIEFF